MITEQCLLRLGLTKLIDTLELDTKEDLLDYMISNDVPTLEELAEFLSESLSVCERCGNNFVVTDYEDPCIVCTDCLNAVVY